MKINKQDIQSIIENRENLTKKELAIKYNISLTYVYILYKSFSPPPIDKKEEVVFKSNNIWRREPFWK